MKAGERKGKKEREKKVGGERLTEPALSPQEIDGVTLSRKATGFPWFCL